MKKQKTKINKVELSSCKIEDLKNIKGGAESKGAFAISGKTDA